MKTIVIIPYRDRQIHLDYYLANSVPKLTELIPEIEFIVVEQTSGKKFNRGKVINVGYHFYNKSDDYYITQDVDVNPNKEETFSMYQTEVKENKFLGIYSDGQTLGGIVKFRGSTFEKVNGFPNDYWGWGHEDKDLSNRAEFMNCQIERLIKFDEFKKKETYFNIFQDHHKREECDKFRVAYYAWKASPPEIQKGYLLSNGLSTLEYEIVKTEQLLPNVKKIIVNI